MLLPKQAIALGRIAAKNGVHPVQRTVRIERHNGSARAIATDGRKAVIFTWDEPDPKEFPPILGMSSEVVPDFGANVPPRILAEAARGVPGRVFKPILGFMLLDESSPEIVRIAATDLENVTRSEGKAEEGDYPPVADVIPRPEHDGGCYDPKVHRPLPYTHVRIAVNGKQPADTVATLVDLAAEDVNNTIVLTIPITPNRPVRLDARNGDRKAVGIVMPVQADFTLYEEPRPHGTRAPKPPVHKAEPAATRTPPPPAAPMAPMAKPQGPVSEPGKPEARKRRLILSPW